VSEKAIFHMLATGYFFILKLHFQPEARRSFGEPLPSVWHTFVNSEYENMPLPSNGCAFVAIDFGLWNCKLRKQRHNVVSK
jgi:hypothetical protein